MINGRYIIQKKIGQGRSKVFRIIDTEFPEREVAAKFLPLNTSNEEKQFFRDEYFTLQALDHPNIIKPLELGSVLVKDEDDDEIEIGSTFIIVEFFNSVELNNYNRFSERQLYSLIKQICSVLFYLHQSNYIYYDLKAENILISEKDNKLCIKLIDFGFAGKVFESENFAIRGTPNYLSPEILKMKLTIIVLTYMHLVYYYIKLFMVDSLINLQMNLKSIKLIWKMKLTLERASILKG